MRNIIYLVKGEYYKGYQEALEAADGNNYIIKSCMVSMGDAEGDIKMHSLEELVARYELQQKIKNND